jgi:glycosyltransferase involved in cell wall biosynthesis
MKIFFDARMITHPGIGRYIRCLLGELKKYRDLELNILGDRTLVEKHLGIKENIVDFTYPIYSVQEQLGFLKFKKLIKENILHVPHYNIPVLTEFNLIVTLHDLIHIIYPKGASKRFASLYMRFMMERALKSAKRVICVSNSTKDAIEKIYGLKSSNTTVIYEGVDEKFSKIKENDYLKSIKDKYKLPDKFILYVGSIRKHKNIHVLLESFSRLAKRMPDVRLVIVGRRSHSFDFKKDNIIYLGEIPDDRELVGIYSLASVFCNLSLLEGFGLTILEAQKCAIPVVCSNINVHREIGGKGILAVSLSNVDQIEEALYNVLTDTSLKDSLIAKGLENITKFSWVFTAERTLEIYKELTN